MGRVSKRGLNSEESADRNTVSANHMKRYRAGIYARLSSSRGYEALGQNSQRTSLEVQIKIAKKFVEEFNQKKNGALIEVVCCYTDMGKTGSNFAREGFRHLLQDIRCGKIDCVIVKDLSRFGRNYLEAGTYIEKIFPLLGVRFIAVSDEFDTGNAEKETKQLAFEIKNLVNDMYAKEFSKRAKLHLKQRREEGSYVGGPPPYGYKAVRKGNCRVLMPDEDTAVIVRFIYDNFVRTESYAAVRNQLNQRKINPPAVYKKTGAVYHSSDEKAYRGWDRSTVERILKSNTYIGILVQGKTAITARNEEKRIQKPEEEWVIRKDAHEPLIAMEVYQKVSEIQKRLARKTLLHKHSVKGYPIEKNIFKRISQTELVRILLPVIRMQFALFLDKPEKYMKSGKERISEAAKQAAFSLRETEGKIRRFCEEESSVYMEYHAGNISQKDYLAYKRKQADKLTDLKKIEERQMQEIRNVEELSVGYVSAVKDLFQLKSAQDLTREMAEVLFSKIYVYPEKRIEILFSFSAEHMEGVK